MRSEQKTKIKEKKKRPKKTRLKVKNGAERRRNGDKDNMKTPLDVKGDYGMYNGKWLEGHRVGPELSVLFFNSSITVSIMSPLRSGKL